MDKVIGIDLGTTNSCVAVVREWRADGHRQPRRIQDDAVDGGDDRGGQAARRSPREAPGDHQRREHRLRRQAAHRAQVELAAGEAGRPDVRRTRSSKGPHGDVRIQLRDKTYSVPEISAMILAGDEAHRRGVPRSRGHQGGRHGPGVLQRQPAPGHQGRRRDRRARRHPHHQRAHRGRARVRLRQEDRQARRGVRPRRRHVRHLDPRDRRGRRVQGHRDRGRHVPRRRGLRRARHRLARRGLPRPSTASTCARTAWRCSA